MSESVTAPELIDGDDLGPVEFIVIALPTERLKDGDLEVVLELVARDVIRVLDLELVRKDDTGTTSLVDVSELGEDDAGPLSQFGGASSGLLDPDDLEDVGELLDDGATAAVLVYEQSWLATLSRTLRADGARIVASGVIDFEDLEAALE